MVESVSDLKKINLSLWERCYYFFCCKKHRNRRYKAVINLKERFVQQLDIRRIISNSIVFNDFIRCFLSRPQLALLLHQRTRIGSLNPDTKQDSSSQDDDLFGNLTDEKFKKEIKNFESRSLFDNNLILGVLFEKGIVPKHVLSN